MPFADIAVCGRGEIGRMLILFEPTHLLSLIDPGMPLPTPEGIAPACHLTLAMYDLEHSEEDEAPTAMQVGEVAAWVDRQPAETRLLVHCLAGVSRSPAMVLGLLARTSPVSQAVGRLRAMRPQAIPNLLIVRHWDEHLGLEGRLLDATRDAWQRWGSAP